MKSHHDNGAAGRALSGSCGVGFVCSVSGQRNRDIVAKGIEAVKNLTHRGAVGADGKTGDGAGVLFELPQKFFEGEIRRLRLSLSGAENLCVGTFFLYASIESGVEAAIARYGFRTVGWRDVPTDDDALGSAALGTKPRIRQLLIDGEGVAQREREFKLFLARKRIEKEYDREVCVSGISSRTIAYKGLLVAPQLDRFYPDLTNEALESAFCVFHQRFSTNTLPEWSLAQPFRVLAHNGEINTLQGNRNWMAAFEKEVIKGFPLEDRDVLKPLVRTDESDSASLDRIIELLVLSGFSPEHAVNLCIPPARERREYDADERAFFEYADLLMPPWDGPAAIVFTDGEVLGAHLDRNGLRPLRYGLTDDGILVCGSEAGMIDLGGRAFREKGRLGPGDTLSVHLASGRIKKTAEVLRELSARKPYRQWMKNQCVRPAFTIPTSLPGDPDFVRKQAAFGYSEEELQMQMTAMAETGSELTFSMGDDTPIPPLADKPQLLFRYFRQRFSQVTNPAIDPIRERMVMSLAMNLGPRGSFLVETPGQARRYRIESPLLCADDLAEIERAGLFSVKRIPTTYERGGDLAAAVATVTGSVVDAAARGAEIVVLTDRDVSKDRVAVPSLLALSASFQELLRKGLAHAASLVVETGEARDIHHFACLIGFGASAVCPYLAFQTIADLCAGGRIKVPYEQAAGNYRKALEEGLLKVMSRHGISTVNSYHGAQLFDTLCLGRNLVREYFGAVSTAVESDGLAEVEESLMKRHAAGFGTSKPSLDTGGYLRFRREGEWHAWGAPAVSALIRFVRSRDPEDYRTFSRLTAGRPAGFRHLLAWKTGTALPLDEVEPETAVLKRFVSGAMSVGALSPEAHETIAEACNRLGMRSNSGEGGEDPKRCGTLKSSAIKQVASGRFGVTPGYLASAREIEIKVAQGAKPGEGGHLPASKVDDYIAGLRFCKPGTLLISPPPHHDIYSIEDLNQLIYDLKQANPEALVCVKLVSETGVGTVAAGVAKAYADIVQISGNEGGTGAAPLTSIKNVGGPWETGLAETQRVLVENGLRERIRVRVDGGLKTGRDVIIAALLGAEEYGFGTATMIAAGCVMARQCHLNTCPAGVATQDPRLRARYKGTVEGVIALFRAMAAEVREILAQMGFRSMDEIIGRTDLLTAAHHEDVPASQRIGIEPLCGNPSPGSPRRSSAVRNDNPAPSLNDRIVKDLLPSIQLRKPITAEYTIQNVDRSVPVRLNYHIAKHCSDEGLPPDTLTLVLRGSAGQSFGAFNHRGLSLVLIGEANDYAGKGMYGGRIVIRPDNVADPPKQVIAGNTVLYGATGGEFFAAGRAGERFCVRNSGAVAVVEGAGQHLCEYMTRGKVVVLGPVGFNVGAGMTGGTLYVMDEENALADRLNEQYVSAVNLAESDREHLKFLIQAHVKHTGSLHAEAILRDFDERVCSFKKVKPA